MCVCVCVCVCVQDRLYSVNLDRDGGHTNYLTTVSEQKDNYSDINNKKADLARHIQKCLCLPSNIDFVDAIDEGRIKECGVDRRHIKITNIIFGPTKAAIEGKTVSRKNKMPRDSSLITHIPPSIIKKYEMVTLGINVLYFNDCPFIIAVSKHIKFFQCMGTSNKDVTTFLAEIQEMKSDYMLRGFRIKMIYTDQAFESSKTELSEQGINLYCCDTNSYVPFIERGIIFVKERLDVSVRCF